MRCHGPRCPQGALPLRAARELGVHPQHRTLQATDTDTGTQPETQALKLKHTQPETGAHSQRHRHTARDRCTHSQRHTHTARKQVHTQLDHRCTHSQRQVHTQLETQVHTQPATGAHSQRQVYTTSTVRALHQHPLTARHCVLSSDCSMGSDCLCVVSGE